MGGFLLDEQYSFDQGTVKASRNSEDYNEDKFHELKTKFQFEACWPLHRNFDLTRKVDWDAAQLYWSVPYQVKGVFHDKGYLAEKEVPLLPFFSHLFYNE